MNKAERAQTYLRDEFFIELFEAQVEVYKGLLFNSHEDVVEGRASPSNNGDSATPGLVPDGEGLA